MLSAAVHAPSAGNTQEWHFIVVKDDKVKEKLSNAALNQRFISKAPVVIVVCIDKEKIELKYGKRGLNFYSLQDTAAATMNILLSAEALGLSTCWVGAFDDEKVGHILKLPNQLRVASIVPVGYSDENAVKPRRIPFERLTHVDQYNRKYPISEAVKKEGGKELKFKPLGNYIEDVLKDRKSKKKKKERTTFKDFINKLRS